VKKRVRTTAGGSTGSVRNLRIREDIAKYLLNLDVNSAHYDPKSRCVRGRLVRAGARFGRLVGMVGVLGGVGSCDSGQGREV
jgi:hypothetical protein